MGIIVEFIKEHIFVAILTIACTNFATKIVEAIFKESKIKLVKEKVIKILKSTALSIIILIFVLIFIDYQENHILKWELSKETLGLGLTIITFEIIYMYNVYNVFEWIKNAKWIKKFFEKDQDQEQQKGKRYFLFKLLSLLIVLVPVVILIFHKPEVENYILSGKDAQMIKMKDEEGNIFFAKKYTKFKFDYNKKEKSSAKGKQWNEKLSLPKQLILSMPSGTTIELSENTPILLGDEHLENTILNTVPKTVSAALNKTTKFTVVEKVVFCWKESEYNVTLFLVIFLSCINCVTMSFIYLVFKKKKES